MSIQSMRNWIKSHRAWILVLFVLLVIGLVATYATSGMNSPTGGDQEASAEDRYKAFETQIATARTALDAAPDGFAENRSLAGLVFESSSVLMELERNEEAQASFKEAATLFQKSLDVAPETLNAEGKAQIVLSIAGCKWMTNDNEGAEAQYQKALELTPSGYGANISYIQYLYMNGRFAEALVAATTYKAKLPEGDENIQTVDQLIIAIEEAINQPADDSQNAENGSDQDQNTEGATK